MPGVKILIVAEGRHPDFTGGAETVILHLSRELLSRGHEVHTLTRSPQRWLPRYEVCDGIHVHRYMGPPIGSAFYRLYPFYSMVKTRSRFLEMCRNVAFDVLIFNQPFGAMSVVGSPEFKQIRSIYIVHSMAHTEFRSCLPGEGILMDAVATLPASLLRKIERYALQNCSAVLTLSEYIKGEVMAVHGEAENRIHVIPGGVDTNFFSPVSGTEEKCSLRQHLNIPSDTFVLFVAKRLYRFMGLETVIGAVQLMRDKNILLLIAGDGPLHISLERQVMVRQLEQKIRFLGNLLPDAMVSHYRASDLFISTRAEPFGLVMLEALACGLPVLSVPAGGAVEILKGLSKNMLFEDAEARSMAHLILKYVDTKEDLNHLRQRCRRYVENNYTWSVAGTKMEQLLSRQEVVE